MCSINHFIGWFMALLFWQLIMAGFFVGYCLAQIFLATSAFAFLSTKDFSDAFHNLGLPENRVPQNQFVCNHCPYHSPSK